MSPQTETKASVGFKAGVTLRLTGRLPKVLFEYFGQYDLSRSHACASVGVLVSSRVAMCFAQSTLNNMNPSIFSVEEGLDQTSFISI